MNIKGIRNIYLSEGAGDEVDKLTKKVLLKPGYLPVNQKKSNKVPSDETRHLV